MLRCKTEYYKAAGIYGQQVVVCFLTTFQKGSRKSQMFNYLLNVALTSIYLWSYAQYKKLMLFIIRTKTNLYHQNIVLNKVLSRIHHARVAC